MKKLIFNLVKIRISKLFIITLTNLLIISSMWAQTPEKLSYQAVVRNSNGALVKNKQVGMQISILQGSSSGTIVYTETQAPTTNVNGLISIEIGTEAYFSSINWGNGPYFIKTEIDPNGGTDYSITASSQLLSVPYALYAKKAESLSTALQETDPVFNASVAKGITSTDTANWNKKYEALTEVDPVFSASVAKGIKTSDTAYWNRKLDHFTETDPLFNASIAKGITSADTMRWNQNSGGGSSLWTQQGNNIVYNNGSVGINATTLNAKLNVQDNVSNDTTSTIYATSVGGNAVKGFTSSSSNDNLKNSTVLGEMQTSNITSGSAVRARVFGTGSGIGLRSDAETSNQNFGTYSFALSKTGNTYLQYGGYFSARGSWTVSDGVGTGIHYGVYAEALGGGNRSNGVYAKAQGSNSSSTNFGGYFYGLSDVLTSGFNIGVGAYADSSSYINRGVESVINNGRGLFNQGGLFMVNGYGSSSGGSNIGAYGYAQNNMHANYGVYGIASTSLYDTALVRGVYGEASGNRYSNYGVYGTAFSNTTSTGNVTAVYGEIAADAGSKNYTHGVDGTTTGRGLGNVGVGGYAYGILSGDSTNYGVYGFAALADYNYGMFATSTTMTGSPLVNCGIYAEAANATTNYAGYFYGNVSITGNLSVTGSISKGSGTFKIDHPLDPENKYLVHSFVESPDMLNLYSGNVVTDTKGYAYVELPDYFVVANTDFRYQLTVIGSFAQAIIKEEIKDNVFVIQTNQPDMKVSWQVTAIRNDKYAQQNRIQPEMMKDENEKGKYLHPEVYGKDPSLTVYPKFKNRSDEYIKTKQTSGKSVRMDGAAVSASIELSK